MIYSVIHTLVFTGLSFLAFTIHARHNKQFVHTNRLDDPQEQFTEVPMLFEVEEDYISIKLNDSQENKILNDTIEEVVDGTGGWIDEPNKYL